MAKERAARRAQREREAAARAADRARAAARDQRRRGRVAALRRLLPRRRRRPVGVLARRRRRQNLLVLGIAVVVQVAGWLLFSSVQASLVLLVFTVFALPVAVTLVFDRR